MTPLRVDFGYELDETKIWNFARGDFIFEIDSDTPVSLFGHTWNINFDHAFAYTYNEPLYYKNTTGISLDLSFKRTTFTVGFDEYVIVNERNSGDDKDEYGDRFNGAYMGTEIYGLWEIPTGLLVGNFGELTYTPKISGSINYKPDGTSDYPWKGPYAEFSHSLGFSRVDWITGGNYRKGLDVEAKNVFAYNFYNEVWDPTLSFTAKGYLPLSVFFGLSGRISVQTKFAGLDKSAGSNLRGIRDDRVQAETILNLNMDFPFRVLHFYPSDIFDNHKLHFFDFEIHASPFVDLALVQGWTGDDDHREKTDFSPKNVLWTSGLEIIVFPAFARSIYLRISLGADLREWVGKGRSPLDGNSELEIVLSHLY
jgi:hypothetical protein